MLTLVQTMLDQLVQVVDFGHCTDGKLTQMRVDHNGLSIRIANDTDTDIADKLAQFIAELCTKIRILDVVDGTMEQFTIVSHHTRTLGTEM